MPLRWTGWRKAAGGRLLTLFLACAALGLLSAPVFPEDNELAPVTIYFFSPESSINNYSMLKNEFDGYLARYGNLKFQPFSHRTNFDHVLAREEHGIFLMSAWQFQRLPDRGRLRPVLVGAGHENKITETRNLWVRKEFSGVSALRAASVATAGSVEYSRALLGELLGEEQADLRSSISLLVVPKDIDALMAVGYGSAAAALTSDCAVEKLAQINPRQMDALKPLVQGVASLRLLVVVPQRFMEQAAPAIRALTEMGGDLAGRERLNMLGLEKLIALEPGQQQELMP